MGSKEGSEYGTYPAGYDVYGNDRSRQPHRSRPSNQNTLDATIYPGGSGVSQYGTSRGSDYSPGGFNQGGYSQGQYNQGEYSQKGYNQRDYSHGSETQLSYGSSAAPNNPNTYHGNMQGGNRTNLSSAQSAISSPSSSSYGGAQRRAKDTSNTDPNEKRNDANKEPSKEVERLSGELRAAERRLERAEKAIPRPGQDLLIVELETELTKIQQRIFECDPEFGSYQ